MTGDPRAIDVNCDLGESFGNWTMGRDEEMMRLVTTANVACGFHGGDPVTMARTVRLAREHGVAVGAHPGLPDLLGFGRRAMALSPEDAGAYIRYQTGALRAFLDGEGMALHHVKPHGALFATLRDDPALAVAAAEAVASAGGPDVLLYWPAPAEGVAFCDELRARGVGIVEEIYPDLGYDADGRLVLQREKEATDPELAAAQVRRFLQEGVVEAIGGGAVRLRARSVCVHGDGPNAVEVATAIRAAIERAGRRVEAVAA